jgi:hypothetical protein
MDTLLGVSIKCWRGQEFDGWGFVCVGLVHGHWLFWVVRFVRLRVYHSGIVTPRDVGSVGVGLGCVVRVQRPLDAPCGLKRGCGPEPRGGNPPA